MGIGHIFRWVWVLIEGSSRDKEVDNHSILWIVWNMDWFGIGHGTCSYQSHWKTMHFEVGVMGAKWEYEKWVFRGGEGGCGGLLGRWEWSCTEERVKEKGSGALNMTKHL